MCFNESNSIVIQRNELAQKLLQSARSATAQTMHRIHQTHNNRSRKPQNPIPFDGNSVEPDKARRIRWLSSNHRIAFKSSSNGTERRELSPKREAINYPNYMMTLLVLLLKSMRGTARPGERFLSGGVLGEEFSCKSAVSAGTDLPGQLVVF